MHFIKINIPPLFWTALSMVLGIFSWQQGLSLISVFLGFTLCGVLLLLASKKRGLLLRKKFVQLILAVTAFLWGFVAPHAKSAELKKVSRMLANKKISLTATVIDSQITGHAKFKTKLTVIGDYYIDNNGCTKIPSHKSMYIWMKEEHTDLLGKTITLKNIYCPTITEINQLSWLKDNTITQVFTKKAPDSIVSRVKTSREIIIERIALAKQNLLVRLQNSVPKEIFPLFSSLFLGYNSYKLGSIKNDFNKWGIVHYLARSGLHVIIILYLWRRLLYLAPLALPLKHTILTLILLLYCALTWSSVSFARSIIATCLMTLHHIFFKQIHPIQIISLTTLLLLIYNPFFCMFLNFQLSFALTLGLILLTQLEYSKKHKHQLTSFIPLKETSS